jgi:HSP20 family protein
MANDAPTANAPAEVKKATPAPQPAPRHPLLSLREEMDRLFDDFMGGAMSPFRRWGLAEPARAFESIWGTAFPTADLAESETEYRVTAELPGVSEKDVELVVDGDVLTIKGQKKEEREEKSEKSYLSERRFGSFERSFQMPEAADLDKVEATFKNGVLTVVVPKRPEAARKARRIEVKAA